MKTLGLQITSMLTGTRPNPNRAAAQLMIRHAIGLAVGFIGSIILARSLGPDAWGVYGIAAVVLVIGQQFVERGAVGYLIQRTSEPNPEVLSTALCVQIAFGVITGLAIVLGAPLAVHWYGREELRAMLTAVAVAVVAYALRARPMGLLERRLRYGPVAAIEVLDLAAFNVVAVACVAFGSGLFALTVAVAVRGLVSLAAASVFAHGEPGPFKPSVARAREMVGYALPYSVANGLTWVNTAAAPLLVGTFSGPRSLGILQLAYQIVVYPQLLTGIIGRVALPAYARINDPVELARRVQTGTSSLLRYAGVATLILAATSAYWVGPIYGDQWLDMSKYMLVIAGAFGIERSLTLVVAALNARRQVMSVLTTNAIFSVVYWLAALALVPLFGAVGLPAAYALGAVTFPAFLHWYRAKVAPIRITRALLEYAFVCALAIPVAIAEEDLLPRGAGAAAIIAMAFLPGAYAVSAIRRRVAATA